MESEVVEKNNVAILNRYPPLLSSINIQVKVLHDADIKANWSTYSNFIKEALFIEDILNILCGVDIGTFFTINSHEGSSIIDSVVDQCMFFFKYFYTVFS